MYVTLVQVHLKPEHVDQFIDATKLNHEGSICEPGSRRFDVLPSPDDPTRFVLYEAYADPEAAAAHKNTLHYKNWRDTVAPWMAAPRSGVSYNGLFPSED